VPKLLAGYASDTGRVRKRNEDLALVDPPLFAVADGMGGHAGGGEAARLAIEALSQSFRQQPGGAGLIRSMQYANFVVWQKGTDDSRLAGMGTTMVALAYLLAGLDKTGNDGILRMEQPSRRSQAVKKVRWYHRIGMRHGSHSSAVISGRGSGSAGTVPLAVQAGMSEESGTSTELRVTGDTPAISGHGLFVAANVGDSRIYRYHDGQMIQISQDHSVAEELARRGKLTNAQAAVHPKRHMLTRVLGMGPEMEVDAWEVPAEIGDRFLLCSDGLSNEVSDSSLSAILEADPDPQRAADTMIRLANEHGGSDNITVVIVDVRSDDPDDPGIMSESVTSFPAPEASTPSHSEVLAQAQSGRDWGEEPPVSFPGHGDSPGWPVGTYTSSAPKPILSAGDATMMLDKTAIGREISNPARKVGRNYALRLASAATIPPVAGWSKRKRTDAQATNFADSPEGTGEPSNQARSRSRLQRAQQSSRHPVEYAQASGSQEAVSSVLGSKLSKGGQADDPYGGQRLFSFRLVLFVLVFLAVVAGAFGVVRWYVDSSYFVMFKGNRIEVFQGRIGGFMGFEPHRVQATHLTFKDIAPYRISQLKAGVEEPSLAAADAYIKDLVAEENSIKHSVTASVNTPPSHTSPAEQVNFPSIYANFPGIAVPPLKGHERVLFT
jgi:protein phosphatase